MLSVGAVCLCGTEGVDERMTWTSGSVGRRTAIDTTTSQQQQQQQRHHSTGHHRLAGHSLILLAFYLLYGRPYRPQYGSCPSRPSVHPSVCPLRTPTSEIKKAWKSQHCVNVHLSRSNHCSNFHFKTSKIE